MSAAEPLGRHWAVVALRQNHGAANTVDIRLTLENIAERITHTLAHRDYVRFIRHIQ